MSRLLLKKIIPFIKARYAPRGGRVTFTQYGEDLIIKDILQKKGLPLTYVDIGAHHPYFGNNTYLLYRHGGRGVLVEPNSALCTVITDKRRKDVCLNAGVSKIDGEADFYEFKQSTRSTFSKEQADEHTQNTGQAPKVERKKILSLDSIVAEHFTDEAPSLVSIDAEGLDIDILSGYSFAMRPAIFCIEIAEGDSEVETLMKMKGYEMCARILQNAIFVDNR